MDDNDNIIDFQKMNFSPFTQQFAGLPANSSLHQFTAAKFAQNIPTSNGQQVVSLVSGTDGNVQFLRPLDGNQTQNFQTQIQQSAPANLQHAQTFILPITMPGEKPGDAQQTVQIQVLNPNQIQAAASAPKYQNIQMPLPIQGFPQQTVLTVSMPPDSEMLPNHGLPEGVTVLAAIQPQDLQLFAQAQQMQHQGNDTTNIHINSDGSLSSTTISGSKDENENSALNQISIKQEPFWGQSPLAAQQNELNEFLARQGISINLQPYLKFDNETNMQQTTKRDTITSDGLVIKSDPSLLDDSQKAQLLEAIQIRPPETGHLVLAHHHQQQSHGQPALMQTIIGGGGDNKPVDANGKVKKKRKYKKKPPKPKPPKPGQVHIATALDGTILFCCPECQMAYAEKTDLEQHLTVHKIERRYICDICGAGLKRKEHLERHKLGHSPERPHICSVCKKGFKRKEHLNLHFVIHSGDKTEICGECGKGFYRKDHLRKHTKSHVTKRLKEELNAQKAAAAAANPGASTSKANSANKGAIAQAMVSVPTMIGGTTIKTEPTSNCNTDDILQQIQQQQQQHHQQQQQPVQFQLQSNQDCQTICLHVPTSDNTTVPVQIKLPQMLTTSADSSNTILFQPQTNTSTANLSATFSAPPTSSASSMLP